MYQKTVQRKAATVMDNMDCVKRERTCRRNVKLGRRQDEDQKESHRGNKDMSLKQSENIKVCESNLSFGYGLHMEQCQWNREPSQ